MNGISALKKEARVGTSLVVQWLRRRTPSAGGTGSIPGRGTKIPRAAWRGRKNQKGPREIPCPFCHVRLQ